MDDALEQRAGAARDRGGRRRAWVWGGAVVVLLLPALAMQVDGSLGLGRPHFVALGIMVAIACGLFELAVRVDAGRAYATAAGIAVGTGLLMSWMNLAVGIIGNEDNPLNLMFAGVLLLGAAGAVLARLRARGMARVLVAMAIAQIAVAAAAQWHGHFTWPINAFFAVVWLTAAALFRRAAARPGA